MLDAFRYLLCSKLYASIIGWCLLAIGFGWACAIYANTRWVATELLHASSFDEFT